MAINTCVVRYTTVSYSCNGTILSVNSCFSRWVVFSRSNFTQKWWSKGTARSRVSLLIWYNMYGLPTSAIDLRTFDYGGKNQNYSANLWVVLKKLELTCGEKLMNVWWSTTADGCCGSPHVSSGIARLSVGGVLVRITKLLATPMEALCKTFPRVDSQLANLIFLINQNSHQKFECRLMIYSQTCL